MGNQARDAGARRARAKGPNRRKLGMFSVPRPRLRHFAIGAGFLGGVILILAGALWWRLGSGPLSVDVVTPWLTAAVEERLGGGHRVEVGGTQIERTEDGHAALRLRDIVVRDRDGIVVASAPKAEVGISGFGLLTGHLQAGLFITKFRKIFSRAEMNSDLLIVPARYNDSEDSSEYQEQLPTSPP